MFLIYTRITRNTVRIDYSRLYIFLQIIFIKIKCMSKKGFTLIELMIVIAIVGILAMSIFKFDFNKKTDTEKRDRMIQKVESMIHSTFLSSLSGRGIKDGSAIINPTSTRVQLAPGSIIGIYYYSGTQRI